ncbi:MAG TPA: Flp family type IVb pilin [Isosphaeraceae bacterium]|jgi:pilus assembly protein Flp/PilA
MRQFIARVQSFIAQEEGATMVEYGLMVALIAIACVTAIALVGSNVKSLFNSVAGSVNAGGS